MKLKDWYSDCILLIKRFLLNKGNKWQYFLILIDYNANRDLGDVNVDLKILSVWKLVNAETGHVGAISEYVTFSAECSAFLHDKETC